MLAVPIAVIRFMLVSALAQLVLLSLFTPVSLWLLFVTFHQVLLQLHSFVFFILSFTSSTVFALFYHFSYKAFVIFHSSLYYPQFFHQEIFRVDLFKLCKTYYCSKSVCYFIYSEQRLYHLQ